MPAQKEQSHFGNLVLSQYLRLGTTALLDTKCGARRHNLHTLLGKYEYLGCTWVFFLPFQSGKSQNKKKITRDVISQNPTFLPFDGHTRNVKGENGSVKRTKGHKHNGKGEQRTKGIPSCIINFSQNLWPKLWSVNKNLWHHTQVRRSLCLLHQHAMWNNLRCLTAIVGKGRAFNTFMIVELFIFTKQEWYKGLSYCLLFINHHFLKCCE